MIHNTLSVGGSLILGAVVALATPALGQAQHGGHGGGGHGGGFGGGHYSGGGRVAGIGSYHGAVHYDGGHSGSGYYGTHYYGSHYYGGIGRWAGYYPYYNYYPYYGTRGYYNSYSDYGTYGYSAPSYGDTAVADTASTDVHQSLSSPLTTNAPADDVAHLTVQLPPDGRITVQGALMNSAGPIQQFVSPPLAQGEQYTYDIEAKWNENGKVVAQTRQVQVYAGAHIELSFRAGSEPMETTTIPEKSQTTSKP